MSQSETAATVDAVLALYRDGGNERYDEVVTQTQHALQAAAHAEKEGASESLVAAALLHDIGHLLRSEDRLPSGGEAVDLHHEAVAARHLDPLFGPAVSRPVALHVRAKRYLCAVDPDYAGDLSPASVRSLALQGGPLDDRQVEAFEAVEGWQDAVRLRRWDDRAKQVGYRTRSLDDYRSLLLGLVRR